MDANGRRQWFRRFLLFATVAVAACGGPTGPTGGTTPTPAPTPTPVPVTACTASAPQPMTSFAADPATITDGDTFTLRWAAPCGFVSLAQKGKGPFQTLLPSTGSYVLRPGLDGYPTASGNTVFEARNADTATPRETAVTVTAKATPTISLAGASSCYPVKAGNAGCNVSVTATATNYSSIAWSGCCAGSSGTTGNCHVPDLNAYTCTASATGAGGSAQADKQVTGTNAAPVISGWDTNWHNPPCDADLNFEFTITDEEGVASCPTVEVVGACSYVNIACPVPGYSKAVFLYVHTWAPPQPQSWLCYGGLVVRDAWGVNSAKFTPAFSVPACP